MIYIELCLHISVWQELDWKCYNQFTEPGHHLRDLIRLLSNIFGKWNYIITSRAYLFLNEVMSTFSLHHIKLSDKVSISVDMSPRGGWLPGCGVMEYGECFDNIWTRSSLGRQEGGGAGWSFTQLINISLPFDVGQMERAQCVQCSIIPTSILLQPTPLRQANAHFDGL